MSSFLERLFGRISSKGSGAQAKERLQFVLLHDRLNLSPERMEALKQEILAVISKYVSVDADALDVALVRGDSASKLVAEVPFMNTVASPDGDSDPERQQDDA